MKTLRGLNQKVAVLVNDDAAGSVPTYKEIALNTVAVFRPGEREEIVPADRLKVTNLGLILLTAKDELEIEDEYFEILKKILNSSKSYSEFIMGQWTKKFNDTELQGMEGKKKK